MMKINREELLNDLHHFASQGNGVIIGSPGVGKTYLLKELRQSLKADGTPHLLFPIDQLGDGKSKTLQKELSYEDDLIEKLKSVPASHEKSILLFDAFDAARNEQTRKRFLRLIRRAVHELKESWNVIVTVRTYDAKKSQDLLDLFGNSDDTDLPQYHSKDILCRHFTIPLLNENEIQQAFGQIPHLESIYKSGSQDFKNLLANPFNIWLLEKILKTSQDVPDFSQIHSEVQLLGLFWQRRIEASSDADARRFILTKIARQMVEESSLTVRWEDIYESLDLDKEARLIAWNALLSDEILSKTSSSGQRIAFSHNILFDYAISILLIEDDSPQQLESFVRQDPSRPLFLRPSLTYFFTRLWYDAPENFWSTFWHILPSNQSVHLRLFARLIPTTVIANEARKTTQLTPLLEKLQNRKPIANEAMMRLLQSLRALKIKRDELWIDFFDQVLPPYHADFAWDLATITSDILEQAIKTENTTIRDACGRVGRRLLGWVWQERETSDNDWYNRFGSSWAVPLVAKTYGTNPKESRLLLKKVLDLTQESKFPIKFLWWLTVNIDKIWTFDPEFVASVYRTVFTYSETSTEQTSLIGSGPVFSFTSNRRQDYDICQYRLIEHFPDFLQDNPLVATQAAIQSLNSFILQKHIDYLNPGVKYEDLTARFEFRGKNAYFVQDNSCILRDAFKHDEPIKIADELFTFIAALTESEDSFPLLASLLDVFRDHVRVAFFWKRLLKTAAQFPEVFAPHLFEICIAKPIQRGGDVAHELGLFLEAVASKFTPDQLRQIEKTILELPSEATNEDKFKVFERQRDRFIARIPRDFLQTQEAKEIRKKMEQKDQVPQNDPLSSFESSVESFSEERILQYQGVDTTKPENQELQRLFEPLDKFNSKWQNEVPNETATELILPPLHESYAAVKGNTKADKKVIDSLWYKLTACVAILGRVANLENKQFSFCRQVLLEAAKHELPKPDSSNAQSDTPMYSYSPFPRHGAAQGLLRFATRRPDTEMLGAIESLASDPVSSVRMVAAMELSLIYCKEPKKFWKIVENRATHEATHVVQKYLYYTLTKVVASKKENEDKTIRIMDKMLKRILPESVDPEDPFIALLMWLAIDRENSWALKTIKDTFFSEPVRFANPLNHAVSYVVKNYVVLKNLETPERCKKIQRAIKWLEQAIDAVSPAIQELCKTFNKTDKKEKKLSDTYQVIDGVVMGLYFEVAYESKTSEKPAEEIPNKLRCQFYNEVKPLMDRIIDFARNKKNGVMFAPTAHHFMQLLASFLSCKPKEILHLAEGVARSSEPSGYNLDSLAVTEVVKFVETVLADHRSEVRDGQSLEDLLSLLDIFAKTGWSDALRLVWRLDEIFR